MKTRRLQSWQRKQIKQVDDAIKAMMKQLSTPERVAEILGLESPEAAGFRGEGIVSLMQKESVRIARETDRRLKARSRGKMGRILDITYQAIRRRPEIFMGFLLLMMTGCAHRPRPHVSWPTELPAPEMEAPARWVCKQDDPHNMGKDCVKRAFHYRVKR